MSLRKSPDNPELSKWFNKLETGNLQQFQANQQILLIEKFQETNPTLDHYAIYTIMT